MTPDKEISDFSGICVLDLPADPVAPPGRISGVGASFTNALPRRDTIEGSANFSAAHPRSVPRRRPQSAGSNRFR